LSATLDPHVCDSTPLGAGNQCEQFGDERLKIGEPIRRSAQNDDCDREGWKILLKGEIPINSDKDIKVLPDYQ
jgi:hypothetical protein